MKTHFAALGAAAVAGALLAGPAMAADLPAVAPARAPVMAPAPVMPVAAPAYSWTGFYVGVNGGFGGDKVEYPFTAFGTSGSADVTSSGWFGGGQIGYNWQFAPSWVAGVETDIQGSGIEDRINASAGGFGVSGGTQLDWFGTVRGRLGYLVTPQAMFYGTGGWAYGHTTTNLDLTGIGGGSLSFGHDKSGWTAGAGIEYAFNEWLSFKTEYLYLDMGRDEVTSGAGFSVDEKTTAHTIKAGLNVKFGGFGF